MTATEIVRVLRYSDFGEVGDIVVGLDSPKSGQVLQNNMLNLAGWIVSKTNSVKEVILTDDTGEKRFALNTHRSDVLNSYQTYFQDGQDTICGFNYTISISGGAQVWVSVDNEVYLFLDVRREEIGQLGAEDIFQRTVEFLVENRGGEIPASLLQTDNKSQSELIAAIWNIALICYTKKPNPELNKALAGFRQKYGVEAVAGLKETLNKQILYPLELELTHHGATRTFRFWREEEIDSHLSDVHEFLNRLSKMGYPSFIFFGTLLGAIRDNSLISHDDDVDTVCVLPGVEGTKTSEYVQQMAELLVGAGGKVYGDYPYHRHVSIGRRAFDVFLGVDLGRSATIYSYKTISCPREELFSLKSFDFRERTYQIPQEPERLLERYYGPNWRVPDRNFYDK